MTDHESTWLSYLDRALKLYEGTCVMPTSVIAAAQAFRAAEREPSGD